MNCPYCSRSVVGYKEVVIVVGEGPAHKQCHERQVVGQRIFAGMDLPALSDQQLSELSDMVKMELNSRDESQDDAIELFA